MKIASYTFVFPSIFFHSCFERVCKPIGEGTTSGVSLFLGKHKSGDLCIPEFAGSQEVSQARSGPAPTSSQLHLWKRMSGGVRFRQRCRRKKEKEENIPPEKRRTHVFSRKESEQLLFSAISETIRVRRVRKLPVCRRHFLENVSGTFASFSGELA